MICYNVINKRKKGMKMMRDLNKIFMECLEEVKNAGIEPGKIVRVSINNRMVKNWGQCKRNNDQYYIEISSLFLDEKNSIDGLKKYNYS